MRLHHDRAAGSLHQSVRRGGDVMNVTKDKHGRAFMIGDILKVFHFTGARKKQYFMYKQIVGFRKLGGSPKVDYFDVSHLDLSNSENYYIGKYEGILREYEIIQGLDDMEDRPKWAD